MMTNSVPAGGLGRQNAIQREVGRVRSGAEVDGAGADDFVPLAGVGAEDVDDEGAAAVEGEVPDGQRPGGAGGAGAEGAGDGDVGGRERAIAFEAAVVHRQRAGERAVAGNCSGVPVPCFTTESFL